MSDPAAGSPAGEFAVAVVRLVERWRVQGPRWAGVLAQPEPSARAEEAAGLVADARTLLDRLARVGLAWHGQPPRAVPDVGVHALADVLAVLAHEVLTAPSSDDAVLAELTVAVDELRRRS